MPTTLLVVLLASVVLVGASVAAMAIGVMFRRPCLRGSCGGPEVKTAGGESFPAPPAPTARASTRPARPDDRSRRGFTCSPSLTVSC